MVYDTGTLSTGARGTDFCVTLRAKGPAGSPRLRRAVHDVHSEPIPGQAFRLARVCGPTAAGQRRNQTGFPQTGTCGRKVAQSGGSTLGRGIGPVRHWADE